MFFLEGVTASSAETAQGFVEHCASGYAQTLACVVALGIPLPAYQAFLWTLIRDGLIDIAAVQSAMRTQAIAIFAQEGRSEDAALMALAAIEGAGALLCLEAAPSPATINARFAQVTAQAFG